MVGYHRLRGKHMTLRSGIRVAIALILLPLMALGSAGIVYAAPYVTPTATTTSDAGYQVRGPVQPIADQQAYRDIPGASFFDVAGDLQRMTNVSYFVVIGQPATGPAQSNIQIVKPAGTTVVHAVEVAINSTAQTQLFAVGELMATPSALNGPRQSATAVQGNQVAPALSGCWNGGYLQTSWYDPINIQVNYVRDTVNWCGNGTYLTSWSSSYKTGYYSPSGWYEVYGGTTKYVCSCLTWGETYTNDRFVNPNFAHACNETDTYYRPNGYIFYGDGTSTGDYNTWATGTCASLLHWAIDIL